MAANASCRLTLVRVFSANKLSASPFHPATLKKNASKFRSFAAFTLIEVLMAATILTVGFMGLIEAVTICSGTMDQARRQTLANQILTYQLENLRLVDWSTIANLPTSTTAVGVAWNGTNNYLPGDSVTYSGAWYRCSLANSSKTPTNTLYWQATPPPYANSLTIDGVAYGANYTITRTVSDIEAGVLREATFTVQWVVTTSRRDGSGNLVVFTYTRTNATYFGKYGLNLTFQRS